MSVQKKLNDYQFTASETRKKDKNDGPDRDWLEPLQPFFEMKNDKQIKNGRRVFEMICKCCPEDDRKVIAGKWMDSFENHLKTKVRKFLNNFPTRV